MWNLEPSIPPHSAPQDGLAVSSVGLDVVLGFGPLERVEPMRMQLNVGIV
jgi:hypothetical protein